MCINNLNCNNNNSMHFMDNSILSKSGEKYVSDDYDKKTKKNGDVTNKKNPYRKPWSS